jgi:hypothetical protein
MANLFIVGNKIFPGASVGGGPSPGVTLTFPVTLPFMYCADPEEGKPLFNASIYIGNPSTDPEIPANQKTVDAITESGTQIPMTQPINTGAGGIPEYLGSPIQLYTDGNFSLKIVDSDGAQQYYAPDLASIETIDPDTLDLYAKLASPVFTGDPQAPTPAPGDNDTSIATTAFVNTAITGGTTTYAPLADPVFTGDPQAPTPTFGDNDNSLATTAFVQAAISAPTFKGFSASSSTSQSEFNTEKIVNSTTITGLAEDYDTDSWFNLASGEFLPLEPGYYTFSANIEISDVDTEFKIYLKKNGTDVTGAIGGNETTDLTNEVAANFTKTVYLNGTSDYVGFYFRGNVGSSNSFDINQIAIEAFFVGS